MVCNSVLPFNQSFHDIISLLLIKQCTPVIFSLTISTVKKIAKQKEDKKLPLESYLVLFLTRIKQLFALLTF